MTRPEELPEFDPRPTVRIHQGMPEKDSIITLSDSAFRLMIEMICYAGRNETEGEVPKAIASRMATKRTAINELVRLGHVADQGNEWLLVDYLRWNRSRSEIESFRASRRESGALGAHMRWHVPRRKGDPNCDYCKAEGMA